MSVLVALSGGPGDEGLLADARTVADAGGFELRQLHVAGGPEEAAGWPPEVELVESAGTPADVIVRASAGADIVAFSTRGQEGPGLGPVARELVTALKAPMLAVRPQARVIDTLRRLLVPLEGSPSTSEAMRRADDAFCARGREIVMLHVVTGDQPGEIGSLPAPRIMDQEHYEWQAWQDEFRMRFSQCPEGGRHRVAVRVGEPGRMIVREARDLDADLIVISWRGYLSKGKAPVVRRLLAEAPCPLLLIPAFD
jgi:nucleotide-binding universal stress UspA family protein